MYRLVKDVVDGSMSLILSTENRMQNEIIIKSNIEENEAGQIAEQLDRTKENFLEEFKELLAKYKASVDMTPVSDDYYAHDEAIVTFETIYVNDEIISDFQQFRLI